MKPTVSVCIATCNHEPYMAKALESVLMQEVDFAYKTVVGEDDSSDGTREIVTSYRDNYPGKIRAFFHSESE